MQTNLEQVMGNGLPRARNYETQIFKLPIYY
jgi:hypothetical protein